MLYFLKRLFESYLVFGIGGIINEFRLLPYLLYIPAHGSRRRSREESTLPVDPSDNAMSRDLECLLDDSDLPNVADILILVMQRQLDLSKAWDSVTITLAEARHALASPNLFLTKGSCILNADECYDDLLRVLDEWESKHGFGSPIAWRLSRFCIGSKVQAVVEILRRRRQDGLIELGIASPWYFFRHLRHNCRFFRMGTPRIN